MEHVVILMIHLVYGVRALGVMQEHLKYQTIHYH